MSCYLTHDSKKQFNKYDKDDFRKKKNAKYKQDKRNKTQVMEESIIRKYYYETVGKLLIKDEYE